MRRMMTFAIVPVLCAMTSAHGSASPPSPKEVRAAIIAAALTQKSVHWTIHDYSDGYGQLEESADVSAGSARARVSWSTGLSDGWGGKFQLVRVGRMIYLRGDWQSLTEELALTSARAKRYAGRWISLPNGEHLSLPGLSCGCRYWDAADRLTLASGINDSVPSRNLRTSHGTRFLRLFEFRHASQSSMSAHANGEPLPVGFRKLAGGTDLIWGTFRKWNEPVHVQVPANSTPIATIRAG